MKVLRYSAALGGIFLVLGATWIGKELSSPLSPQRGEEAALLYERETKTEEILPITLPHAELKPVSLFVVGDILLARDVDRRIRLRGEAYPFEKIVDFLKGHDIVFGNLEGPLVDNAFYVTDWTTRFSFPAQYAALLHSAGFTALNIANNHIFDVGASGVEQTKSILAANNLKVIGSLSNQDIFVSLVEIRGRKIGIIGFSTVRSWLNRETMRQQIEDLARRSDYTVVTVHWGIEYTPTARNRERELAEMFIQAGADVVFGHHPHVVQDVELINGKPVFYSLGNFLFDQYFRPDTMTGLGIGIELTEELARYQMYPLALGYAQPALMGPAEQKQFLNALEQKSDPELQGKISEGNFEVHY